MRRLRTSLLACATVAAAALCVASCSETVNGHYETMGAARADGAVVRGWIPEWVPEEATDIDEEHDLDSNRLALNFTFPKGANLRLPATCKPVDESSIPYSTDKPATAGTSTQYIFFHCSGNGGVYVAMSSARGNAFVWSD